MSEMWNFQYTGLAELEVIESNLENYNNFIVSKFFQHSQGVMVVDFGKV
jgi:hypothetical protein